MKTNRDLSFHHPARQDRNQKEIFLFWARLDRVTMRSNEIRVNRVGHRRSKEKRLEELLLSRARPSCSGL